MPVQRRPVPDHAIANLLRGLAHPLEALAFISEHSLW